MTGRGLGHTGGTVDKLESISGLRTELSRSTFLKLLRQHGLALSAQSSDLAPADGKIYALRDVTGTIESIPLIAASIMSKKLAVGPSHLLLDVKVGTGAFMKTVAEARRLAETMVSIGEDAGVRTLALLSSMEQPLGRAVGNALEVTEAVDILRGTGPADVTEICLHETASLLELAGLVADETAGYARARRAIANGSGLEKLMEVVAAQGGDRTELEDTSRLPQAPVRLMLAAPQTGYISAIQAERVGMASVQLGAGRVRKGDPIDHAVGLILQAKVGDYVKAGSPLVEVHARTPEQAEAVFEELQAAYSWSEEAPMVAPLILGSVYRSELA
jgi:pyrimidine-nucleoside phosphorylase